MQLLKAEEKDIDAFFQIINGSFNHMTDYSDGQMKVYSKFGDPPVTSLNAYTVGEDTYIREDIIEFIHTLQQE